MANDEETWTPRKALRDLLPEGSAGMPSLDAWSYNDLRDLEHYLRYEDEEQLGLLLDTILRPDEGESSVDAVTGLRLYAANAAKGMRHRQLLDHDQATRFEKRADDAYANLPAWARW